LDAPHQLTPSATRSARYVTRSTSRAQWQSGRDGARKPRGAGSHGTTFVDLRYHW